MKHVEHRGSQLSVLFLVRSEINVTLCCHVAILPGAVVPAPFQALLYFGSRTAMSNISAALMIAAVSAGTIGGAA
jgi:hypothetical protein